jgi:hypothetical protein
MNNGSMAMNLKNHSFPSGGRLSLHVRRRHGKVGATSRSCWRFFNVGGVIYRGYAHSSRTVTKQYYIEVLRRLWDVLRRKDRSCGQVVTGSFITMRMPTPQLSCRIFLAKHRITQVCQPPYSPELTTWNFWLFPKLKSSRRFVNATVTQYKWLVRGIWQQIS